MRHKRITYEITPIDEPGDYFCWVPGLYRWIQRRELITPAGTLPYGDKRFCAFAEARTLARAFRIANRYPGREIRIVRLDRHFRCEWILTKERT